MRVFGRCRLVGKEVLKQWGKQRDLAHVKPTAHATKGQFA